MFKLCYFPSNSCEALKSPQKDLVYLLWPSWLQPILVMHICSEWGEDSRCLASQREQLNHTTEQLPGYIWEAQKTCSKSFCQGVGILTVPVATVQPERSSSSLRDVVFAGSDFSDSSPPKRICLQHFSGSSWEPLGANCSSNIWQSFWQRKLLWASGWFLKSI